MSLIGPEPEEITAGSRREGHAFAARAVIADGDDHRAVDPFQAIINRTTPQASAGLDLILGDHVAAFGRRPDGQVFSVPVSFLPDLFRPVD